MSKRLSGKRVLLTGGVANIGLAILEAFVAEGATVSVVDIDAIRGADVEKRFDGKVRFFRADLSKEEEIKAAIEALFSVKVTAVNTLVRKGKLKRFRGTIGRQGDVKKAVVTLADGHSIDVATGL